ncbi:MAG: hypothetical protein AB1306_03865 [Nitrospirota bacterium]
MTEFITNSYTHAVTQNHFHGGQKYSYCIDGEQILCKVGLNDWMPIVQYGDKKIKGSQVKRIAADNNRLFVLTSDNELYWRCMEIDTASWVIFLLDLLMIDGVLLILFGLGLAELIISLLTNCFNINGQWYPELTSYAAAYRQLSIESHDRRWNLLNKPGLPSDDIVDIAVGNWMSSVVTYYVLMKSSGKIFYTDEEPQVQKWYEVKGDKAPTFDENSRICASHSVVAATKGSNIHWIRIDAHNPEALNLGPLSFNFTEVWYDGDAGRGLKRENHPGWHTIQAPTSDIDEFFIDVGCGNPWPLLEANEWLEPFRDFVADGGELFEHREGHQECGFLTGMDASVSRYDYPFCCVIKQKTDEKYKHILVPRPKAGMVEIEPSVWEDVEINPCLGFVGNVEEKELHMPTCSRVLKMSRSHRKLYATIGDALADGYDGCYYCLPKFDTDRGRQRRRRRGRHNPG